VRLRRCLIPTGSCNCAVIFREGNNILGINACQLDRPPMVIKYLVDPIQPADDILISADGLTYIVSFILSVEAQSNLLMCFICTDKVTMTQFVNYYLSVTSILAHWPFGDAY